MDRRIESDDLDEIRRAKRARFDGRARKGAADGAGPGAVPAVVEQARARARTRPTRRKGAALFFTTRA